MLEFVKTRAFPSFYQDYAPKLVEFFGVWVAWLSEKENAAYIIDHLSSEHDIDESVEAFKTHLKRMLINDYPDSIAADLKLLLKNIFYLYNSKSSIKAYDFLFRCLYNSPAEITYPKENILRASDGRWNVPKYMSAQGFDLFENLNDYASYMIIGEESGATAYLDSGTVFVYTQEDGKYVTRNSIALASVDGAFISGEHLLMKNPETDEVVDIPELRVEFYEEAEGQWIGTKGFLNSDMVIQDSYYYQDFSYIIKSNVSISRWRDIVKRVIHPAGLQFFGDLLLSDDGDGDGIQDMPVNPTEFLRWWHILLKMYVFDVSAHILFADWKKSILSLAQRHSETTDNWLYFGRYLEKNGYYRMEVSDINNTFNRSSVLLFREDGTLIHPDIINWGLFTFEEDILGNVIHGVTLEPRMHVCTGIIEGNSWRPEKDEDFIQNHYMIFITDQANNNNIPVKSFVLDNEYLRFDVKNPEGNNWLVRETFLDDIAQKDTKEYSSWRDLTIKDYIVTSKEEERFYDIHSLLKIPDSFISSNGNQYTIANRSYDRENIVIFSYSPRDFTHRIFVNRENNKVSIYYSSFIWYNAPNPENPILDSNLQVEDYTYSGDAEVTTDFYQCESLSYDDEGNEIALQQTQFTLELPYEVNKENILLFVNGLYSTNYKIKGNTILIDTEENDREIIAYLQEDKSISLDKEGKKPVWYLDRKYLFYDKDGVKYYVQPTGFISEDYVGDETRYRVFPYNTIEDMNGIVSYYLWDDNTISQDPEGNKIVFYRIENILYYDKEGTELAYFINGNNITNDLDGNDIIYTIRSYKEVRDLEGRIVYYWNADGTVTRGLGEKNAVYNVREYEIIVDRKTVLYFVQQNRSISTDVFGREIEYYLQPDNVISTSYILYNSSETLFATCDLGTILSKSETNTSRLEDIMLLDDIVVELDNAVTKEFGDLVLSDLLYYIYGVEQTKMRSTAELYLLSPTNAMRKQTNSYSHDRGFIYNSAVLNPYTVFDTHIEHTHILDMSSAFDMGIEFAEFYIRWLKFFSVDTNLISSSILSFILPAQNHSETMDSILNRNFDKLYDLSYMGRENLLVWSNAHSLMVFNEKGVLVPREDIDFDNHAITGKHRLLYSVRVSPDKEEGDNYFLFDENGLKVLDTQKNVDGTRYYYNDNYVQEYYQNGTDDVIYLKTTEDTIDEEIALSEVTFDTYVELVTGEVKKLKDVISTDTITRQFYSMTGEDLIPCHTHYKIIDKKYILVFVDGHYTRDWEYRNNGSVVLNKKPEASSEVYVLYPYDYNSQGIWEKDNPDGRFTFDNFRTNILMPHDEEIRWTSLLPSDTDLLFFHKQLDRLRFLNTPMNHFWRTMTLDTPAEPHLMMHFSMDGVLYDGWQDIFPYVSGKIKEEDTENDEECMKHPIRYLESKMNRYATMLFDDSGLLINPVNADWGNNAFNAPPVTKGLTVVCLNGEYPAIVGILEKTHMRKIRTFKADIQLDIVTSPTDIETIENLDSEDNVVRDIDYTLSEMQEVGSYDYLYTKVSDDDRDTLICNEDDYIPENYMMFVNGKKVWKEDIIPKPDKFSYVVDNSEKYFGAQRIIAAELGSLREIDFIMNNKNDLENVDGIQGEDIVLEVKDEIYHSVFDDLRQVSDVVISKNDMKECVVFQYNPNEVAKIIEEKAPENRFFELPEVGFRQENILAFINGVRTRDFIIEGNMIAFPDDITLDTVEVYVFKKYDYLHIDENKYNRASYTFTTHNIKRSLFF